MTIGKDFKCIISDWISVAQNCAATLGKIVEERIEILDKEFFLTSNQEPYVVLRIFSEFIEKHIDKGIKGIGISCGGPLDSKCGIIMKPPSLPLWDNIEVVKYFEDRFKIKTYLQNDANACAVAEWKHGAGMGSQNMIFLTFGTGFGAGLILDGKLYSGTNDNAGEIGHVRLTQNGPLGYNKRGSCEGYCSGSGIKRLSELMSKYPVYKESYVNFEKVVGKENISAKTIAEYAKGGNKFCIAVFKKSGEKLGRILSILIDILNPEKIVIGGVYMRATDLLYPYAVKIMKKECLPFSLKKVEVIPAGLSENIGDIAALSIAKGDF